MFDVNVSEEQKNYSRQLVQDHNFGQRGEADGSPDEQYVGMLGQTVMADLLGNPRPTGTGGFDGGHDFIINNKKVDVKTMSRTTSMRNDYVHNFIALQKGYDVDYYIFLSFNKTNNILTVCGYITKTDFFEKSSFYKKGTIRKRKNRTTFPCKADLYEIKQSCLEPCSSISDLTNGIL